MAIHTRSALDSFERLRTALSSGERTFYTRYGDGDIYLLRGEGIYNHKEDPKLTQELTDSILIEAPGYMKAMCVNYDLDPGMEAGLFTWYPDNDEMAAFLSDKFSPDQVWKFEHHFTLPYYAIFRPTEFIEFFETHIRSRKKLFVGGVRKEVAEQLFGPIDEYVQTPLRNAFGKFEEWIPEVLGKLDKVDLVLPTAGAAGKVLNKRLWELGYDGNSLDVGALIDWVDGRRTRKWIKLKGHKINDVLVPAYQKKSLAFQTEYAYREAYYKFRRVWKGLRGKL